MKEATGELNMTVITVIAIGAVIAFFWFMWPSIRNTIARTWGNASQNTSTTDCPRGYNASTGRCN